MNNFVDGLQKSASARLWPRRACAACFSTAVAFSALGATGCAEEAEGPDATSSGLLSIIDAGASIVDAAGSVDAPTSPGRGLDAGTSDAGIAAEPGITIKDFSVFGNCPTTAAIADDRQTLSLKFDKVRLEAIGRTARTSCSIDLRIAAPPGYAYKLESVSGTRTVDLPARARASFEAFYTYGTDHLGDRRTSVTSWVGPMQGRATFQQQYPDFGFSCRESVHFVGFLSLLNPTGEPANVTLDTLEFARFSLKPCADI